MFDCFILCRINPHTQKNNRLTKIVLKNLCELCARQAQRPVGSILKLGCLCPSKVGVAHCTFWLRSAKSWGGLGHPGHPSTYGPDLRIR